MIRFGSITIDQKHCVLANGRLSYQFHDTSRRIRFRLMQHLLMSTGMSMNELFDALYEDQTDGGPLHGPHIIQVYLTQMQPIFDLLQLELHKAKIAGEMHYWLRPYDVARQTA